MIITELYKGQGLGNQLACYVTTRVLALDLGFDFGIMHPERFKGHGFFEGIDFGCAVEGGYGPEGGPPISLPTGISNYYVESALRYGPSDIDIRSYDKELRNIKDGTKIDGLLQGEGYFLHRREEIKQWLKLNPKHDCFDYADENTCIINFRGGEYSRVPEFFLGKTYWDNAISKMLEINSFFRFVVITDDVYTARKFFPKFPVFHFSIGKDYSIIKNAQYLILSNSSFGWFPSWLSENQKYCIAPKYWARHNISDGYWSLGYNLTSGWHYMDRQGNLHSYEDCLDQLASFEVSMKRQKQQPEFASKNANFLRRVKGITPDWVKKLYRGARGWTQYVFNLLLHPVSLYLERKARSRWLADIDLSEYKKTIRVYDVFYFFNELDLLEIRLNILDRYVDYFVLVEFSQTFGGVKKDSFYKKNKDRYAKWNHKIIYFLVDDYPSDKDLLKLAESNSNVGNGAEHWVREFYLKESAKKALSALNDEDIVFVSDLDEIWDPGKL